MRENYVNVGRRRQSRRRTAGRILVVIISAVIIFILSLMLGNYLRAQIAALPPRGDMPEEMLSGQLPADTSDASRVSIMASSLPLGGLSDTAAISAVVEELTLGSREAVSLCLRDAGGEVHFRSDVAQRLTGQASSGVELPQLLPALKAARIYTSAVLAVTSFAEPDQVTRDLQRAFEISLAAEIGSSGVDELLLTELPVNVDTLDDVTAYIAEISAQLDDQVHLAVAVPPALIEGASGTVLAKQLSQYADTIALDLRSLTAETGSSYPDAVAAVLADASLYFSKYNMRVILPVTEDNIFSELRQILELNAVHNWQIIE
ncbi:MAG: hypothetical protein IJC15_04040 [Clostridia bacterium]|nr:hypothetical protein [Clostridia bacterium]